MDGICVYQKYAKRALDITIALMGIAFFSLVLLTLAIWIKTDSKGPVIFKQRRIGRDKRIFHIWKYRTMISNAPRDVATHLLDDPIRYLTKPGRFLRRTSLDELPQLFNILFGQMSFIGPRPALWNQYDLIDERDKYGANAAVPGLTGWAQVHGRDELPIPVKARLDGEYVKDLTFWLDFVCLLKTFRTVPAGAGVVEGSGRNLDAGD
jgi:O-antigen biosynthesis protein WbqP